MKRILILFLLLIPLVAAIPICQDEQDVGDVPCAIVTPILNCSTYLNVTNTDNSSDNFSTPISAVGDGTYNFTWNISTDGSSYSLVACNNATASITLGHLDDDYNDKWLYFYLAALGGGVLLFVFGLQKEDNILKLLSSFLIIAFSITFISVGYPTLTNDTMRISITLITLGVGLYIMTTATLNIMREGL